MNFSFSLKTILLLSVFCLSANAQDSIYFLSDPSLDPSGETIVFSYDGDLWKVNAQGGQANRITALDGNETRPAYSPDGKWIAFSSTQNGNKDIYVMPSEGGEIRQLTYHQAYDDVDSWSWDSKSIYFTSNRVNRMTGFQINIDGGTPVKIFKHYFNTVHNLFEHPSSGELFFNESWESKNFAHRKGYVGSYNPDIKSYNLNDNTYKEYTQHEGKDFGLCMDEKGNKYFMSDQFNGVYNLYSFENDQAVKLTSYKDAIYWPKVNAQGGKVVFTKDYQIYLYDVNKRSAQLVNIKLNQSNVLSNLEDLQAEGKISYADLSPDGKKLCFVSRGRLFIADNKGEFIKELDTDPLEAVKEANWMKDNQTILYTQSTKGYYNFFTINAKSNKRLKQHSKDKHNNKEISFNSDRTKAVYLSGKQEVRMMDLASFSASRIAKIELWDLYSTKPKFSPDDNYVLISGFNDFERDIYLYDVKKKTLKNISNTNVTEGDPCWSPDGKYIYFDSDPLNHWFPYGTKNSRIWQVPLTKMTKPFKSDKLDELFEEEKEMSSDKKKKKGKKEKSDEDKKEENKKPDVIFDYENLMERAESISPNFGQQFSPHVLQKDGKTHILYVSNHAEGKNHLWKTTQEDFKTAEHKQISKEPMTSFKIIEGKEKLFILAQGNIHDFNVGDGKLEKLKIKKTFSKTKKAEFEQMFYEAWVGLEQNFYDENFHGVDWIAMRDKYAAFLPAVNKREDLRRLINDMLGELNTSHFGFYSNGKEEKTYFGFQTAAPGIVFNNKDPFIIESIVENGPSDYTDANLMKGDRLIAVDGIEIDKNKNRNFYFSKASIPEELELTVERNGDVIKTKCHPTQYWNIKTLLYDAWQDSNQDYVDAKSDNKIAYVHMKNMGKGELNKFNLDLTKDLHYKEALILDLRYNTGGNVHDDVLRILSQKSYLKWKYRDGKYTTQSNLHPADKPIVLLINEQSLSDAEMTTAGFKALGLGTVVGVETYRWIIFTSGMGLVDGSFYRLPSWGCYTLDGKNLEKTGVAPDVEIKKDFKDRLEDNHPQLDKAIELILEEIK